VPTRLPRPSGPASSRLLPASLSVIVSATPALVAPRSELMVSVTAIIVGCDINEGSLRVGTPLCVIRTDPETKKKEIISLGKVYVVSSILFSGAR
jgi:hypothetical protein